MTARPDVVLVVLGCVRADRLAPYGCSRSTTPFLDGLARDGLVFDRAVTPTVEPLALQAGLLTGEWPRFLAAAPGKGASEALPTLFERFQPREYARSAFYPLASSAHEIDGLRGADTIVSPVVERRGVGAMATARRALASLGFRIDSPVALDRQVIRWLRSIERSRPFLAMIRIAVPDLVARPTESEPVQSARARYEQALTRADERLQRLATELEQSGRWRNTVVAVVSDHGDLLGEGGAWGHPSSLREPCLRVPLILHGPGVPRGLRAEELVSTIDVAPTLASICGLEPIGVGGASGRSLLVDGRVQAGRDFVYADNRPLAGSPADVSKARDELDEDSISDGRLKLRKRGKGRLELFDLVADPGEAHDAATDMPEAAARLEAVLQDWASKGGSPRLDPRGAAELADVDREELAGLGYID